MSKETEVKSKRPPDDAFRQQKLPMFQPIMTPIKVILLFFAIGVAFVPAGVSMLSKSDALFESRVVYDDGSSSCSCCIQSPNAYVNCPVDFTFDRDVTGPLYVYYELTNFYQNHRRYVNSRSPYQLGGEILNADELKLSCDPALKNGSQLLNPCGLIANSYFTDYFNLTTARFTMDETGIAWESDKEKYKQPKGFESTSITCGNACSPGFTYYSTSSSKRYNGPEECYCYKYPEDSTTQYLYETYFLADRNDYLISPIDGVTDEHFMVWMRTAALPTFRKLYGKIDSDFNKGDTISFDITANFEVASFGGTKALVVSTLNDLGGKNPYLGISYIVVGSLSLLFGSLFALKHMLGPRPIGDPSLLPWT